MEMGVDSPTVVAAQRGACLQQFIRLAQKRAYAESEIQQVAVDRCRMERMVLLHDLIDRHRPHRGDSLQRVLGAEADDAAHTGALQALHHTERAHRARVGVDEHVRHRGDAARQHLRCFEDCSLRSHFCGEVLTDRCHDVASPLEQRHLRAHAWHQRFRKVGVCVHHARQHDPEPVPGHGNIGIRCAERLVGVDGGYRTAGHQHCAVSHGTLRSHGEDPGTPDEDVAALRQAHIGSPNSSCIEMRRTPMSVSISRRRTVRGGAMRMVPDELSIEPTMTPRSSMRLARSIVRE